MRKRTGKIACMLFMLVAMLVTACGGGNGSGAPAPTTAENKQDAQANQETGDKQARTIKHAMGETKIEGTPKRIVVLTNQGTESLLALGIKPVGAVKSWVGNPWYDHIKDKMDGVEVVGDEVQPNIELIASLKPDLILGTKVRQEKIYSQLSSIAPTVMTENLGDSMVENFQLYAEALNKEAEGKQVLADFDKAVGQAKSKIGDKTKYQVSLARFQPDKVRVYFKNNFAGVILDKVGFGRPEAQNKDEFSQDISKEQISMLDGDILFYFTSDRDGDTAASKNAEEWLNDPLAKNMKVVQEKRAFKVNEPIWNSAGGIIAATLMVKDLEDIFSKL